MNVFILNTGRCGSSTFIQACRHISNYTAAHESLSTKTGEQRFSYPQDHIEADNRLSWLLGRLDKHYGDDAFYVHLSRDRQDTVASFSRRIDFGIMRAYEQGVLMHDGHILPADDIAGDYIDTVENNINLFLKDKQHKMGFSLENAEADFAKFWENIHAQGDLQSALNEWSTRYNAS